MVGRLGSALLKYVHEGECWEGRLSAGRACCASVIPVSEGGGYTVGICPIPVLLGPSVAFGLCTLFESNTAIAIHQRAAAGSTQDILPMRSRVICIGFPVQFFRLPNAESAPEGSSLRLPSPDICLFSRPLGCSIPCNLRRRIRNSRSDKPIHNRRDH